MIMTFFEMKNNNVSGKAIIIQDFIMDGLKKDYKKKLVYIDGIVQIVNTSEIKYCGVFDWDEDVKFEHENKEFKGCLLKLDDGAQFIIFEKNNLKHCVFCKELEFKN